MLPPEIVANVWHHLTIKDLVIYGACSRVLYDQVHNAIRDTVHATIRNFVDDPTRMLNIMLEQKAVISGSVALYVMFSINIIREATDAYGWRPGDMDLYVPNHEQHDNVQPLIAYLTKYEGYQLSDPYTPNTYSLYDEIKDIIPLINSSPRFLLLSRYRLSFCLYTALTAHSIITSIGLSTSLHEPNLILPLGCGAPCDRSSAHPFDVDKRREWLRVCR